MFNQRAETADTAFSRLVEDGRVSISESDGQKMRTGRRGKVGAKTIRIVNSQALQTIRKQHLESTAGARGAGTQMHARGEPGLRLAVQTEKEGCI